MFAMFRSHDFGRKAYGNYRWLGDKLGEICQQLGCNIGNLCVLSCSAFIRKDEIEKVREIVDKIKKF